MICEDCGLDFPSLNECDQKGCNKMICERDLIIDADLMKYCRFDYMGVDFTKTRVERQNTTEQEKK